MRECLRVEAPELLLKYGRAIAENYVEKRRDNPSYEFKWPQRERQKLGTVVHVALEAMTQGRCAYRDLYPNAGGDDEIDHFRPKSRPEFYHLVCTWENLFLICTACNGAKSNDWEEAFLRPDEPGFSFSRYFSYRFDTAELEPNAAASDEEQHRAKRTIEILDLNRPTACVLRRQVIKLILHAASDQELEDLGYRYLIPLCR